MAATPLGTRQARVAVNAYYKRKKEVLRQVVKWKTGGKPSWKSVSGILTHVCQRQKLYLKKQFVTEKILRVALHFEK